MVITLISACGTGAFRAPSTSPRASATGSAAIRSPSTASVSPNLPASTRRQTYTYSLPYGDTSYAQPDEIIYGLLLAGNCASAQENLDRDWWDLGIGGPREVVMMQVAIEMCRKNDSAAHHFFHMAETRYGWSGLSHDKWSCNIYRATESFWLQVPQNSPRLTCPGGKIPLYAGNSYFPSQPVRACEDPRFGTGECAGPAPSVTRTTPIPSPSGIPAETGSPTPATGTPISSASASTTS